MELSITSDAFSHEGPIPVRYTCDDADVSPPLSWSGAPADAKSLVLIVEDPDAPDPKEPKMIWDHWLLYNLPADCTGLAEDVASSALPRGTLQGRNSWKRCGYGGPCPPIGRHRYFFRLYALDCVLPDMRGPEKATLTNAMDGHVLADAVLMGTFERD